jgi:hypothetical protein
MEAALRAVEDAMNHPFPRAMIVARAVAGLVLIAPFATPWILEPSAGVEILCACVNGELASGLPGVLLLSWVALLPLTGAALLRGTLRDALRLWRASRGI